MSFLHSDRASGDLSGLHHKVGHRTLVLTILCKGQESSGLEQYFSELSKGHSKLLFGHWVVFHSFSDKYLFVKPLNTHL